ncbi:transcription factor bHLH162-like [Aristolochia californica]|uniref:transcription factor bHLH162-like n=1 Tax=Aristolochia californica TaxID=171875 RepID=UPI0035D7B349
MTSMFFSNESGFSLVEDLTHSAECCSLMIYLGGHSHGPEASSVEYERATDSHIATLWDHIWEEDFDCESSKTNDAASDVKEMESVEIKSGNSNSLSRTHFAGLPSDKAQMNGDQASGKLECKIVEKNITMHMKSLCSKLAFVITSLQNEERLSQEHSLEQATIYIKKLQEKINKMKEKKDLILAKIKGKNKDTMAGFILGLRSPVVEITDSGSNLMVVLITGFCNKLILSDAICVLEEEGVEVSNASFSTFGDKIFYIIHSQVASSRVGYDTNRVYQRLKELVH